jgi:hypothetical protein
MGKLQATAAVIASGVLLAPALASAAGRQAVRLSATMTPAQVVTPANKAWHVPAALDHAHGSLSAALSADGRKLSWKLSYANLGERVLVIADIHTGKSGRFGPILVRLCGPCRTGQTGVAKLKPGALGTFKFGDTWATLITDKYPNGAVRGQIRSR